MQNQILIKAKSQYFEIEETVSENKAVERLESLRDIYKDMHHSRQIVGTLKVDTSVVAPIT